jgi:hypothetical protein
VFLLWVLVVDTPGRLARLALSSLPDFDYAGEIEYLRAAGRYGEALVIADEGLRQVDGPQRSRIEAARTRVASEQSSWVRRAREVGMGAISGRGDSIGAVAADILVVGDVRDLVIQGTRYVVDGETDEVIVVLSGVGLATTLAPEVDWAPAVLKAARKARALTRGLADELVAAFRRGGKSGSEAINALMRDVVALSGRVSPAGAARAMRHADSAEDVARLARFVERQPSGPLVLHALGDEAAQAIKTGHLGGRALAKGAASVSAEATEAVLVSAAKKGPAGRAWLRVSGRAAMRPHPLVGLAKGLYKGNVEALARRISAELDPRGWWLMPLVAAWCVMEAGGLVWRLRRA